MLLIRKILSYRPSGGDKMNYIEKKSRFSCYNGNKPQGTEETETSFNLKREKTDG